MPFPMIHLLIAEKIIHEYKIEQPEEFLLGSISPDSVHQRDGYESKMKVVSHLCIEGEKWGRITNNDTWIENVLNFANSKSYNYNKDFLLGYICHVLVDIQNNIKVWRPFLEENHKKIDKYNPSEYHKESALIDRILFDLDERKVIWDLLGKAAGCEIKEIVRLDEIIKMRDELIDNYCVGMKKVSVDDNRYVTIDKVMCFINEEAKNIGKIIGVLRSSL